MRTSGYKGHSLRNFAIPIEDDISGVTLKFILAGNHREYLHWCKENKCPPFGQDYFYLDDISSIRGHHGIEIERYGTFYKRPDIEELEFEIMARIKI